DAGELAEDDDTDLADVQVLREAERAVLEAQQLVGHHAREALDAGDAVRGVRDAAHLLGGSFLGLVGLHEAVQCGPDLVRPDRQLSHCSSPVVAARAAAAGSCSRFQPARRREASARRDRTVESTTSAPTWMRRPPTMAGATVTFSCTGLPYERSRIAARRSCCAGASTVALVTVATRRERRSAAISPNQPSVCTNRRPRSDAVARRTRLRVTSSTLPATSASTRATRRSGAVVASERTCLASRCPSSDRLTRNSSSSTVSSVARASADASTASTPRRSMASARS